MPKIIKQNQGDLLSVKSGGSVNIESGGALKIAGTDKTAILAATVAAPIAGAAAGYKIARGIQATGAASEDVVTGLTTVVGCVVSLVGDPSLTHAYVTATPGDQAGAPAAGSVRIKSWKPTSNANPTPIAATSPFGNVAWIAIGT